MKKITCCPRCGNTEIKRDHNFCIICGLDLRDIKKAPTGSAKPDVGAKENNQSQDTANAEKCQMKIIRISTDLTMTTHDFPTGTYEQQNRFLRDLIGNGCEICEHVMPKRLYECLHMKDAPTNIAGQCVSMLVDEEGLSKENTPNLIGSYLYETDKHHHPIMGNVLFVGEEWTSDGVDFCGIEESEFQTLELQLSNMIAAMKATLKQEKEH